ncbi:MAG: hypothetical protein OXN15_09240, partial [Chloroflexota bacterium]|nr:hypothetical protein [Chloroflexota bacterium]
PAAADAGDVVVLAVPTAPIQETLTASTASWESLPAATRLALSKRSLADRILALPWVEDGVSAEEQAAVDRLVAVELAFGWGGDPALVGKEWVVDGLDEGERSIIALLELLAVESDAGGRVFWLAFLDSLDETDKPILDFLTSLSRTDYGLRLLGVIIDRAWVSDGLDVTELAVLRTLQSLEGKAEDEGSLIGGMALLDSVEDGDLPAVRLLASVGTRDQPLLSRLLQKSWVQDGFDAEEARVVTSLGSLAGQDRVSALAIVTMPFLDKVGHGDAESAHFLADLSLRQPEIFGATQDRAWVRDGIDVLDVKALDFLDSLADSSIERALFVAALPFLETLEPADAETAFVLSGLGARHPALFGEALERTWVRDGIDEAEALLVREMELMQDRQEAARRWVVAARNGGGDRPFLRGSLGRRFDSDDNSVISYYEAAAAAEAHLRDELSGVDFEEIASLYLFADGLVSMPTFPELAAAGVS